MVTIVVTQKGPLKPCPFCGGTDLHVETDSSPDCTLQVICDNLECEAQGPNVLGQENCEKAWNDRYIGPE